MQEVYDHFKRLDILVNNAGIFPMKRLRELDAATWDRTNGVNLRGAHLSRGTPPNESSREKQAGGLSKQNTTVAALSIVVRVPAPIGWARSLTLGEDANAYAFALRTWHRLKTGGSSISASKRGAGRLRGCAGEPSPLT